MSKDPNRECNDCTYCCKIMGIAELEKPQYKWCEHCKIGEGCGFLPHAARPQSCKDFECLWLQGLIPEECRPDKCHVIFDVTSDGVSIVVQMDPHYDVMNLDVRTVLADMYAKKVDVIYVSGDRRKLIKGFTKLKIEACS